MKTATSLACLLLLVFGTLDAARAQESTLRIGDTFTLSISGVPIEDTTAISKQYSVGDSGTVGGLPYISAQRATGLSPSALARRIEEAYRAADIYTSPAIVITLNQTTTGTLNVSVLGEVRVPNAVPHTAGLTILDAIARCGGFSDFADPEFVKLMRNGQQTVHDVRSLSSKDNVVLQAGDQINVAQKRVFKGLRMNKDKDR